MSRELTLGSVNVNFLVDRKEWGKLRGFAISIGTPAYGCAREAVREWNDKHGGEKI